MNKKRKLQFTQADLIVVLIISLLAILLFLFFAHGKIGLPREKTRKITCASNLKQIGLASRMYSNDHNGYYMNAGNAEDAWEMLRSGAYLELCKLYTCPSSTLSIPEGERITLSSYAYAVGLSQTSSVDSGFAQDKIHAKNHLKFGCILFVDGCVRGYSGVYWYCNNGSSLMR